MSLFHAERELKSKGRKDLAKIVAGVREAYGGDIPLPQAQSQEKSKRSQSESIEIPQPVELDLGFEWQRQASRYTKLGYHAELNLTEEDYLTSLPKFEPQPQEYKGKFDIPLLVETRIPWKKQAELSGIVISDYLLSRMNETGEWDGNPSKTPSVPYSGYFNSWGQRFTQKISPFDARKKLTKDECGAGPHEGIAMQVAHPEFTQGGKYFDLIGYRVGSDSVVCLDHWNGRPRLDADWGDSANPHYRPLVHGSKIVTG